jgi:hypothetical protein
MGRMTQHRNVDFCRLTLHVVRAHILP